MNNNKLKDTVLAVVVITLVGGSLALAIMDENYRSTFVDLAKVGVGGYIGLTIPKSQSR
ncbi:hypothetical protein [Nostoc sp. FACHB-110]|uniref:hypothetical protein n=1 Tax=Nostoc sp. FACHB-110 TaxID=2692834 RepID=UPI001689F2A5|nr:hypothetical protein [Nostoc sp. FACHB-110]MBD2437686.1 hypothetical protein [Nostoc sp. FACHB-110]